MAPDINECALCTRDKCSDTIQDFYLNLPAKSVLTYIISVIIYIFLNECILPLLKKGLACGISDAAVGLADNDFKLVPFIAFILADGGVKT